MRETDVVFKDWSGVIVELDICELVMFPLIARSTVEPLTVFAKTVFGLVLGIGVGDGEGVGVGVGLVVGEAVGVGAGVGEGEGEGVGVVVGVRVNELLVPVCVPS